MNNPSNVDFVIIGEGNHFLAISRWLLKAPNATIKTLVSPDFDSHDFKDFEDCEQVDIRSYFNSMGTSADWLVAVNCAALIPEEILRGFNGRALNLHNGPLPQYAGRHVTQWAIRNGETEFASTIHYMLPNVDAGNIVAERRYPVKPTDTGLALFRRSFRIGRELMIDVLRHILTDQPLEDRPQDLSRRHNYRHRDALDARVPWTKGARAVADFLRASDYRPLESPSYAAQVRLLDGRGVRLYRAIPLNRAGAPGQVLEIANEGPIVGCGKDAVMLSESQMENRGVDGARWRLLLKDNPNFVFDG